VPSPPKLDDAARLIRRLEVLREAHVQHQGQADRHVAVPGKIEVDLHRKRERAAPRVTQRHGLGVVENGSYPETEGVGDHDLLEQANRKNEQPGNEVLLREHKGTAARQLRNYVFVANDRACDQMRKEGDEETVTQEIMIADFTVISADQIYDLLECEERYG